MSRILILTRGETVSPGKRGEVTVRFEPHLSDGISITIDTVSNLVFSINDDGQTITSPKGGYDLRDFDLVVFRGVYAAKWRHLVAPVASFLIDNDIPYLDSKAQPAPASKYAAVALRRSHGFATIPSLYASNSQLKQIVVESAVPFDYPLIIKDLNGHKGRLNFLARTPKEALSVIEQNDDTEFIIQGFIPNDGDYRFLVLGDRVVHVKKRVAAAGSHLNNTSQGGTSHEVPLDTIDPSLLRMAVDASALENLQTAGVDIVEDKETGRAYVLEVNSSPQFPKEAYHLYVEFLESRLR